MFTKTHILAEIRRTAQENSGRPLGIGRFGEETGIQRSDWMGKYWARWGDALMEAGFEPNALQGPRDEEEILEHLARFTRELGRFPVSSEMKLRARTDREFPWHNTFARFGRKRAIAKRLRSFSLERGYTDVADACDAVLASSDPKESDEVSVSQEPAGHPLGYVYLLKSGRYFKVGRSNSVGRRERELSIQLPQKAVVVHSIKTDDPGGIEAYWHLRFSERRKNGEWFELSKEDVAAFMRRKFM